MSGRVAKRDELMTLEKKPLMTRYSLVSPTYLRISFYDVLSSYRYLTFVANSSTPKHDALTCLRFPSLSALNVVWEKKDEIQYFSEPWRLADQGFGTGEKFCLHISCLGEAEGATP